MVDAHLSYASPGRCRWCSERGQAEAAEFTLRSPGTRCRRRSRSVDGDSFDVPSPFAQDLTDCANNAEGGSPERGYCCDLLVADAARNCCRQVLWDCERHQWIAWGHNDNADRQSLANGTRNVDAEVDRK
jgi:hypothetical protein